LSSINKCGKLKKNGLFLVYTSLIQMESIIIKRSPDAQREQSFGCLLIVAIPVIGYLIAMFTAKYTHDVIAFGITAAVFLFPGCFDLIATMIPLKAAMIISDQGLTLSSSKGLYDSFAFWQKFHTKREKLILWENIREFKLMIRNEDFTMCPTDGTGPITIITPRYCLYIENKTRKDDVTFSIHGLNKTPVEIWVLCDQFLKKHGCAEGEQPQAM
jgi:hypothetical protein